MSDLATDPTSIGNWLSSSAHRSRIDAIAGVTKMTKPDHMIVDPYDFNLYGASKIHHACNGPFGGLVLGDPDILDRELSAVLAIYLARDTLGTSLVVVPEGKADEWLEKFRDVWEQGYGPKVIHLKDLNTSATELLAGNWDVVICGYAFVQSSYKKLCDDNVAPLHAPADGNEIPWKTVYLDDSHVVVNTASDCHIAIQKLHRRATVCLTAYPIWDLWADVYGAIKLLRGHPWTTKEKFTESFGSAGTTFDPISIADDRLWMIKTFLQAIMVMRPESALEKAQRNRGLFFN